MKYLLLFSILLVFFSCRNQNDLLTDKIWYPTKLEKIDTQNGLYAISFTSDSMKIQTLGTEYYKPSPYRLEKNQIYLNTDSKTVQFEILQLNENELTIQFDSSSTVTYTCSLGPSQGDLSKELRTSLLRNSWMLEDSVFMEFIDSLDTRVIKEHIHEHVKNVDVHFRRNNYYFEHHKAAWGVNYANGNNILVINEVLDNTGSQYFVIENVSDTLITGFKFDWWTGERKQIRLKAVSNNKTTSSMILGDWQLESFSEEHLDFDGYEVWATFGEERGIDIADLQNKTLSISFNEDGRFEYLANNQLISRGTWHLDNTGKIVRLRAAYSDETSRTTYQSIITLNSTTLVVYKTEDIAKGETEFEVKRYIETFRRKSKILFDQTQPFEIVELSINSDYPSSDPDTSYCSEWRLTRTEVSRVLKDMKPITGHEWHYLFEHYPCVYRGTLEQHDQIFEFAINGGSWLTISSDTTVYFGDTEGKFEQLFLDTVWDGED